LDRMCREWKVLRLTARTNLCLCSAYLLQWNNKWGVSSIVFGQSTHSSPVAPFGFVGPGLPPHRLPRHLLHFHGQILKTPGIVRCEYDVIQGVVE